MLLCWLALFEPPSPPPEHIPSADDSSVSADSAPPVHAAHLRIHPRELVGYGSLLGVGLLAAAWLWAGIIRQRDLAGWFPTDAWALDLLIGAALGVLFAVFTWRLEDLVPALKDIERIFLATLDMQALRPHHAVIFGLLAGIPEEVFFRGAMQSAWGIVITALIFGMLHAATPAYFVYATAAGGMLGVLTAWRAGLWAAIAAHTVIDIIMFGLLMRAWHKQANSTLVEPSTSPE